MKSNRLKTGIILSYAAILIQSLISLIYTPALIRLLGAGNYGLLQLAVSTIANLSILSFGFTGSYMRFYAPCRDKDDRDGIARLNGVFIILFLSASVLALAAGGVITAYSGAIFSRSMSDGETATLKTLLGIITVNMALTFPSNVFDIHIAAEERFTFQKLLVIITAILNPIITLPLLLRGGGAVSAALCITAITAVKLTVNAAYCVKRLKMRFSFQFDKKLFKELFIFSFFVFLNIISDQINWNVDKTILGIFRGAQSVTLYSLGSQINGYFLTFSYALYSIMTPRTHMLIASGADNDIISRFFTRFGKFQLIIMSYIFIMFLTVGKPFMRFWSGLDSDIPYYTALILISPIVVTSAQSIGIEVQRAKDMHRFRSVLYVLIAVINVTVSIPLCIRCGEIGAAAGTCICLIVGNIIIMNIYYHKRVGIDMIMFWREAAKFFAAFIAPLAMAVIFNKLRFTGIIPTVTGAAAVTAVYAISVHVLALGRDDKKALKTALSKNNFTHKKEPFRGV